MSVPFCRRGLASHAHPSAPAGVRARVRGSLAVQISVLLLAALFSLAFAVPAADAATVVKIATLAPDGSVWDKTLRAMGDRLKRDTGGNVVLRLYPGGVAGDEPDIVRKMNIGQLQGAALTSVGLASIDPAFGAFQRPLLFDSYEELSSVLAALRPTLDARLARHGYVLLAWGHGGWLHLFSTRPVRTVADLEQLKIFSWSGDEAMVDRWRRAGFKPVPLAATDILTGLTTGMIDALPTTPLAALSLQWFRHTPYMQDFGIAPLIGATVMHKRLWDRLTDAQRTAMRQAAQEAQATLLREVPAQDQRAITAMVSRGLEVIAIPPAEQASWNALAERFAADMRAHFVDQDLLAEIARAREAFRARAHD